MGIKYSSIKLFAQMTRRIWFGNNRESWYLLKMYLIFLLLPIPILYTWDFGFAVDSRRTYYSLRLIILSSTWSIVAVEVLTSFEVINERKSRNFWIGK